MNSSPRLRHLDILALLASKKATVITLLAVTLLAWGLRLHRLDAQSLWYDEGVTATLAQRSLVDLTQWTARDIQPPLYYYVVWGWGRLAGWSEWSLRFISAWWGVLTTPLLAALAQRLTGRRMTALVAALLTALHPLWVYYSQEARMYTMLVTLSILAVYTLLRAGEPGASSWRPWLIYGLVATAAVYTHYFAFFLLLALGVAFLTTFLLVRRANQPALLTSRRANQPALRDAARRRLRHRRLLGYLATHLVIFLLYLAWIGALLQQLRADTSYWQGRLKVWEALRGVALRFTSGETVLEQTAVDRLPVYAILTLLTLLAIGWQARRHAGARRTLLYLLCWLVIPIAGVLGLAAFVPKFNARYVMLALPGLLLVWSAGIGVLIANFRFQISDWLRDSVFAKRSVASIFGFSRCITGLALGLILLSGFWMANHSWFTDPAFTKAQWRELTSYVREQHEPDEAIVLVSGHAWPIWDYYAPDLPVLRLPDIEILDVNAVLDFANTGELLRTALQDKKGVWLVNWQAEVVDPNGVVPRQLLRAGHEDAVTAEFWQIHLRHFGVLDPTAIQTTPPIDTVLDANFGDQIHLQGYTVTPDGDLLLFWQLGAEAPTPLPDLQINLRTVTAAGLLYTDPADRRPADYGFPVMRWQPGQTVMGRIPAAVWAGAGALPGRYQVQLGVYDPAGDPAGLDLLDPAGNPIGKFALLEMNLSQVTPAEVLPAVADAVQIAPGLRLAFSPGAATAEAGQVVAVTLQWFLEKTLDPAPELFLQWRPGEGTAVVASEALAMAENVPMSAWPPGQWLRQVIAVQPPLALPPGDYLLEVVATHSNSTAARHPFTILPSRRNFTAPPLAVVTGTDFVLPDDAATAQVRLLGLQAMITTTAKVNDPITLDLVWQATAPTAPVADYVVTLQLLGRDGRPVAQVDQPLPGGSASWLAGQIERQSFTLMLPSEPDRYRLILALYHTDQWGFPRLTTSAGDNFVELGMIMVTR